MEHSLNNYTQRLNAAVIGGVNMDIWGRPQGELVLRDSTPGSVSLRPGGVGRNIAHDLRLLGVETALVAALGGDVYAAEILRSCGELGLDMSMSPVFPERGSSVYLYVTDGCGDMLAAINDMDICAALTPERIEPLLPRLNRVGALVLDANLPQETIEYICRHAEPPVYADPVSAAKAPRLLNVLDRLYAIKPNLMEARTLTGENDGERAARALLTRGVKRVFLSLGSAGMLAAEGKELLCLPCERARVINTTGAGDAATAAIVWAGLRGLSLRDSALAAMRAGALTCESDCANSPRLSEIAAV